MLFCLMAAMALFSCSDDSETVIGTGNGPEANSNPGTEVYIQGKQMSAMTRGMENPTAYYYVRIDNRIPGYESCSSTLYWPQTADGQSVFSNYNSGKIDVDYPYWNNANGESNIWKYVLDTTGKEVEKTLVDVPSLESMMKANRNNQYNVADIDFSKYKVIWYVTKYEWNRWHVDGVLTLKETTDVSEIPNIEIKEDEKLNNSATKPSVPAVGEGEGNVEVDVHQQEHSTWDEIKTSIHVRDLVDSVKVEIPLEFEHVAESDDFAIRTYDFELESKVFINGHEYSLSDTNPIKVSVEHQAKKVVITVSAINKDYITALRKEYGDGITVEVHTYAKGLEKEAIWTRVKATTATVYPEGYKNLLFPGATNAFGFE